jgi:hypothetical protein
VLVDSIHIGFFILNRQTTIVFLLDLNHSKIRKTIKSKLNKSHQNYISQLLEVDEDGERKTPVDGKKFWQYIKSKKRDSCGIATLNSYIWSDVGRQSFSTLFGILSGPFAFLGLTLLSSFFTPSSDIFKWLMSGNGLSQLLEVDEDGERKTPVVGKKFWQ